jgi:alkylation response protein AidB-like acyl-CoA dehydrogenase/predicted heme/steroid binding protein
MPSFTVEEIAKHNSDNDCWIIVENKVYDVTKFLGEHPGGKKILAKMGGMDATKEFHKYHSEVVLKHNAAPFYIGDVAEPADAVATKRKPKSEFAFGDQIPYCDPSWYQEWHSPYYNDSHRRFREAMRAFVEKEIMPYVDEWDDARAIPKDLAHKCFKAGWLPLAAATSWPTEWVGDHITGGIKPEELDTFHNLIMVDELSRCGSGGVVWGICGGLAIGLPPLLHFASQQLKERVVPDVLMGKKVICLCVTEPSGGSDVANLTTTARKTADGKHYIVNGEKKWITNGTFADYFTVAVRTGDEGMMGISMLLLERGMPGLKTRAMKCSGMWGSGTAYVTFEDVLVPVENIIGDENQGFMSIMYNFNHERSGFVAQATRFARVCYEDSFRYAMKRKTFGKRLVDHQAIRQKLANMARQIEALQAQMEYMGFQANKMSHFEALTKLAGPLALLKAQSSQVFEYCAREAAQIFGGLSYTCGGQGARVERLYREVRAYAIPGGSEEIMLDLGMRMAVKKSKL